MLLNLNVVVVLKDLLVELHKIAILIAGGDGALELTTQAAGETGDVIA